MQLRVRPVLPNESELLARLGRETFYETWKDYNTEEDMRVYLADAFNEEKIKKDLLNTAVNTFLFVFADDEPAGYAKMRRDRTYDEFNGEQVIEVERIYIYQKFQKQQAGIALMDECLRIAIEEKNKWIWLGVNIDNHKAINFYKRYGFEIFGSKMFKLGDAEDEDYLMKRRV